MIHMTIQTQEVKETMDVPSKEGLTVRLEMSVLYHLDPEKAADVYRTIGLDYPSVLLEPQFRSVTRGVTAGYEARALYTSEREQLAHVITADLQKQVGPRGVVVESTPMRKLTLPDRLASAIEDKLNAEQESQRMQFVLQREQQESERKRIEAQGVADFQRIVSQGISEPLLRVEGHRGDDQACRISEREGRRRRIGKGRAPAHSGGTVGRTTNYETTNYELSN